MPERSGSPRQLSTRSAFQRGFSARGLEITRAVLPLARTFSAADRPAGPPPMTRTSYTIPVAPFSAFLFHSIPRSPYFTAAFATKFQEVAARRPFGRKNLRPSVAFGRGVCYTKRSKLPKGNRPRGGAPPPDRLLYSKKRRRQTQGRTLRGVGGVSTARAILCARGNRRHRAWDPCPGSPAAGLTEKRGFS